MRDTSRTDLDPDDPDDPYELDQDSDDNYGEGDGDDMNGQPPKGVYSGSFFNCTFIHQVFNDNSASGSVTTVHHHTHKRH